MTIRRAEREIGPGSKVRIARGPTTKREKFHKNTQMITINVQQTLIYMELKGNKRTCFRENLKHFTKHKFVPKALSPPPPPSRKSLGTTLIFPMLTRSFFP